LVGHLTNEEPAPTKYISPTPNTINISDIKHSELELTEDFVPWKKSDRLLRGWIIGTLSEEALGLVVFFFFFFFFFVVHCTTNYCYWRLCYKTKKMLNYLLRMFCMFLIRQKNYYLQVN
jgi:hypothetical protein